MTFRSISAGLDMCGCPNRCKHCWLGVTPNGKLSVADLKFVADAFRPFTNSLEVFDHFREPDYASNYKELWQITAELSDTKTPHFELISYWRAVRDREYIPWIHSLGVRTVQLTIFGNEETTDFYVGRKGAFNEILQTIKLLRQNGIAPRIQTFVNKNNISQLPYIQNLLETLEIDNFFLHQGSCSGENEQFYDVWITPEDVDKIPLKLIDLTIKHFGAANIWDVLGEPEKDLCSQLAHDSSTMKSIVSDSPFFFVDKELNVYPNYEAPTPFWCLGNLKKDGAEEILKTYVNNSSIAQRIMTTVPIGEMVSKHGNPESTRLFQKDDYVNFVLNKYVANAHHKALRDVVLY